MKIKIIDGEFSVCQINDIAAADLSDPFVFVGKTDEELSLVCRTDRIPANTIRREDGWRAMRIEGELDFSLIGILAKIASLLADAGISIFAVSTYNTDYLLVKENMLFHAIEILKKGGYEISEK